MMLDKNTEMPIVSVDTPPTMLNLLKFLQKKFCAVKDFIFLSANVTGMFYYYYIISH